jgi:hypothetical protein
MEQTMATYIKAVKLPNGDLISIEAIVSVKKFESGVGILDLRNRMLGWIEIAEEDTDKRIALFDRVRDIFDGLINNRRRAQQPDWAFLQA